MGKFDLSRQSGDILPLQNAELSSKPRSSCKQSANSRWTRNRKPFKQAKKARNRWSAVHYMSPYTTDLLPHVTKPLTAHGWKPVSFWYPVVIVCSWSMFMFFVGKQTRKGCAIYVDLTCCFLCGENDNRSPKP